MSSFFPHALWQDKGERIPASLEEDRLEELALKKDVKKIEEVSCEKEIHSTSLEDQIKKLIKDKESILKEIADLKKVKEDSKEVKKEITKNESSADVLGIISQLTSLMISSQMQQQMMMNQMFSMMQNNQNSPRSFSPMSDFMSPYAFNASEFYFPKYHNPYSLEGAENQVGINRAFYNEFNRAPSAEQGGVLLNPELYPQVPHNGFNFNQNSSSGANNLIRTPIF